MQILFRISQSNRKKEINEIRIWISQLKSTLRTDFSEVKSVFGFRVRLGNPNLDFENLNPDLPIERTVDSHTNSVISHAVVKMASKTVTRSFTQDTDKTYLKAYPLSKQRVLYIGIPSCCLYLRLIFSTFIDRKSVV